MNIKRGTVWWWNCPNHNRAHIQEGMRPVVVVSNDTCNEVSSVVTVVPFTTQIKKPYPQQVPLVFDGGISIALADQITSIPVDELHRFIGYLKDWQMEQVDRAVAIQLGFVDTPSSLSVSQTGDD